MITLFVNGKPLGTWSEAENLFREAASKQAVEFRDSSGRIIAQSEPADAPDWVSAITTEETARRQAGEFVTFDEMKTRLGWE